MKLQGGREVHGVLKGFDPLVNVVLDECIEFIRGEKRERAIVMSCPFLLVFVSDCLVSVKVVRASYSRTRGELVSTHAP